MRTTKPQSDTVLIEVRELSKHYGGVAAVENVSLAFQGGTVVARAGGHGAGECSRGEMLGGGGASAGSASSTGRS